MRTASWSKAIRKIEKVHLIDLVQYRYRGPLDDLVFQRRDDDFILLEPLTPSGLCS